MKPEVNVLRLAEAVADGVDVDWGQAESSARTDEERRIVQQLRSLAGVGAAARAQASTWGPLEIRREVGSGAFGTVYRAWDSRLEREVALKLLHGSADQSAATAIIKEGRLLAQIRHPNVVTVYGADQYADRIGIWMEFVTGRTLKAIVTEQGPFGAHEAALIGRELCRALAAVHRQGFVHRDVKAQNVMREAGGRTVLMDFGAGEAIAPADDVVAPLRGTPAYLAPELLEGGRPSAKSDIYSLGVLLYFLVSGTFLVVGSSIADFRQRHAAGKRNLLRDERPDLPSEFVRVIDLCTAPRPEDRPDTVGAVEALLDEALGLRAESDKGAVGVAARQRFRSVRWASGGAAIMALVLGLAATGWVFRNSTAGNAAAVGGRDSVAILPFSNLTGTGDDDFLSEGITADLIANLSALRDLRVIGGSSTRKYKDRQRSPVEIGAELGVATVLDASVRRSGDSVRIVAHLIDARSGEQIWSDSFNRQFADIVAMKSDVSSKIAVALKGELSQRDMELLGKGRQYDHEAFVLYLKGRHYWGLRTEDAVNRAIPYFHDALQRDPGFAPAYAGLADAYTALGIYGAIPREEANARAFAAAEKAVQLDSSLAEAHASLGQTHKNRLEWDAAEQSFKRAIELKPGYPAARLWYSVFLTQHGRFAEAIAEARMAISLDPLSVAPRLQFGALLIMARRYDAAIAQHEQVLAMESEFATAYRHMAHAYLHKGEYDRALALLEQAGSTSRTGAEDPELMADLGFLYAASGREVDALKMARNLIQRHEKAGEAVMGSIAAIYAGLGRSDEAIAWLERARDERDPETGYLLVDPRWDTLRGDARFQMLLRTLGFKPIKEE